MEEGEGKSGGHKTSFTTSIVVMPPYEFWEQLQVIRSQHDKGYVRWPPHINMSYPFLPQEKLQDAAIKLAASFQSLQPFPLRFEDFDLFEHGKSSCTVWLKPEPTPSDALHVLQQIMEREFPECNELSQISESGFTPHLSIANDFKTKGHSLKMIAEWKKSFKPFEFTVKEVYIISRSGFEDPFEVRHVVPLGASVTPPHFAPNPIPPGAKVLSETRILVQNVPVNLLEDELEEVVTQAIDFPLDKYSVKLIRKNKTSGRQNKNTGRAFIDVKSKEEQQKILALDTLTWEGETMTLSAANA